MLVRRAQVLPIEAIVRGYITGSGWKEYQSKGTVHGLKLPEGLEESQEIPGGPIFTPSTKADQGQHDENIHPDRAADLLGSELAKAVESAALELYTAASKHAASRGILLADTKFEFGLVDANESEGLKPTPALQGARLPSSLGGHSLDNKALILVDEVLTPDSSRFWGKDDYAVGRGQASWDKQYVRDWLKSKGLDKAAYEEPDLKVRLPDDVVQRTSEKYQEAYEKITGNKWQ